MKSKFSQSTMTIIGRDAPIEILTEALASSHSEFIAIYGRRRIGKIYLVKEFMGNTYTFSYTGIEDYNTKQQLSEFHRTLLRYGLPKCGKPQNWFDAFDMLRTLVESKKGFPKLGGKKVIFIDELPWMDARGSDFVKALGHFWNDWAAWTKDIVMIICGSATSWMVKKVFSSKGGLYNRITRQIELTSFTLNECEKFSAAHKFNWSRHLITEAYMIFGGVPYYWTLIDPAKSLSANIDFLFFSENAPMKIEYHVLFKSMFTAPERYESIVKTLIEKKGGMTAKEISEKSGVGMSAKFTEILTNLKLSGFVIEMPQPTKKQRGVLFKLADNFTLFYNDFVLKKKARTNYWATHQNTGTMNSWRGLAFERVCYRHIHQIQKALGVGGVYCEYFAWSVPENESYPAMQIDMIIDRADGIVNICEMKFTNSPFSISPVYLAEMNLRRSRYQQEVAPKKGVQLTMVASSGLVKNPQASEINSVITLDDLFQP